MKQAKRCIAIGSVSSTSTFLLAYANEYREIQLFASP